MQFRIADFDPDTRLPGDSREMIGDRLLREECLERCRVLAAKEADDARQVILLTDSSKWSRAGFVKVALLTKIDTIITDRNLPAEAVAAIGKLGIEQILV